MQLSIVTTLYRSAKHLVEFLERMRRAADALQVEHEIILVNDASPDDSLAIALRFVRPDSPVRVIDLARRYGHYEAMLAGLRHARGEYVFLIDSDLEEPPELLHDLWAAVEKDPECDLTVACQVTRRGRSIAELGGALYYRMLRAQTGLDIPRDNLVARLMTRRYVDALLAMSESAVSFDALSARAGFRHQAVAAVKESRGTTTYSLMLRITIFIDSMLSYGSGLASAVVGVSALIAVSGLWSLFFYQRAFGFVMLAAIVLGLLAIALLCRYQYLILEEIRYRPAQVRRVYPDA
jgi:putative glycosyltransferase